MPDKRKSNRPAGRATLRADGQSPWPDQRLIPVSASDVGSALAQLTAGGALIACSLTGAWLMPLFTSSYGYMNVQQPLITRLFTLVPPLVYGLLFMGGLIALVWAQKRVSSARRRLWLNLAVCCAAVVALLLMWLILLLPMYGRLSEFV